ncbi:MAG: hypothetical protein ACRDI2_24160, partial [Chloroflexota bacterium]
MRGWLVAALALLLIPAPPYGVPAPYDRAQMGVAPLAAGVHAPNRQWDEADFARVAQGRFGAVKLMSYH